MPTVGLTLVQNGKLVSGPAPVATSLDAELAALVKTTFHTKPSKQAIAFAEAARKMLAGK
jgi:hypothetical protein